MRARPSLLLKTRERRAQHSWGHKTPKKLGRIRRGCGAVDMLEGGGLFLTVFLGLFAISPCNAEHCRSAPPRPPRPKFVRRVTKRPENALATALVLGVAIRPALHLHVDDDMPPRHVLARPAFPLAEIGLG